MDNNKDKDYLVRNDAFTDDLREALRRTEARRSPVEVPADFMSSVMEKTGQKAHRKTMLPALRKTRMAAYRKTMLIAFAAAASITLLFLHHFGKEMQEAQAGEEQVSVVQIQATDEYKLEKQKMAVVQAVHTVVIAQHDTTVSKKAVKRPKVMTTALVADSIARLSMVVEEELERVGDECYMQRLSRTITSTPQLSRVVGEFVSVFSDTIQTTVCMKAI